MTEKRLIPEFIEQRGVQWELGRKKYVVDIQEQGGFDGLIAEGVIETSLKVSGVKALGVVFDADDLGEEGPNRWGSIRAKCNAIGINLPEEPKDNGFIMTLPAGIRFGVWMMPDNKRKGMLETFLCGLIPDPLTNPLLQYARECVDGAKKHGAPFRAAHVDKALIHTWLAWQDAPGSQLHDAVKFRIFRSDSPDGNAFAEWFLDLFSLRSETKETGL